jgi:hypothetical protein
MAGLTFIFFIFFLMGKVFDSPTFWGHVGSVIILIFLACLVFGFPIFLVIGLLQKLSDGSSGSSGSSYGEDGCGSYSEEYGSSSPPMKSYSRAASSSEASDSSQLSSLIPGARRITYDPSTKIKTVYNERGNQIAEIRPETKSHLFSANEPYKGVYNNEGKQILEIREETKPVAFGGETKVHSVYNSSGSKIAELRPEVESRGFVGEDRVKVDNIYDKDGKRLGSLEAETDRHLFGDDEDYQAIYDKDRNRGLKEKE